MKHSVSKTFGDAERRQDDINGQLGTDMKIHYWWHSETCFLKSNNEQHSFHYNSIATSKEIMRSTAIRFGHLLKTFFGFVQNCMHKRRGLGWCHLSQELSINAPESRRPFQTPFVFWNHIFSSPQKKSMGGSRVMITLLRLRWEHKISDPWILGSIMKNLPPR